MSSQHILAVRPVRITKDRRVEYLSTEEMLDLFKRLTTIPAESQGFLFMIDFTRPYDAEYFKQFVNPQDAYVGLVDWSVEPGTQPYASGSKYVAKVKVEPGQEVYIRIPVKAVNKLIHFTVTIHAPPSVAISHYIALGGKYTEPPAFRQPVYEGYGINDWVVLVNTWTLETTWGGIEWVIKLRNDGTETAYVYIAQVMCVIPSLRTFLVVWRAEAERTISNKTETYDIRIPYVLKYVRLNCVMTIAGDGTNPITVDVQVLTPSGYVTIASISRTETDYATYSVKFALKQGIFRYWDWVRVRFVISTSGTGKVKLLTLIAVEEDTELKYPKRTSGSYTSDGDGTADTVTILDYTEATKHISRLMRVKATGDSNTKELKLKVDGQEVWDFLNDGDTCTLELRDVKKVELIVNDPGGGTTTTVSYTIHYVEENAHLVK